MGSKVKQHQDQICDSTDYEQNGHRIRFEPPPDFHNPPDKSLQQPMRLRRGFQRNMLFTSFWQS